MISGELPPVKGNDEMKGKVKGIIEIDDRMKYLKEAIEHVTA